MIAAQAMPRPPSGRAMHIYVISRLFRQNAPKWESMLRELEADEEIMGLAYAPLRRAIIAEMKVPGSGVKLLSRQLANLKPTSANQTICKVSKEAFDTFIQLILPQVASLEIDFVNMRYRSRQCLVGEYSVSGCFHAKIRLHDGSVRYAYFHASEWKPDEEASFVELLTMLAEDAFGCDRSQVWFVNLREKKTRQPSTRFIKLRREIEKTVRHLARFHPI